MKNWYKQIILVSLIALMTAGQVFSQSTKKKTTRIRVEYYRTFSNTEKLVATMRIKEERYVPLNNAVVEFYNLNDSTSVLLGKSRTNEAGEATFVIDGVGDIYKDSLGLIVFAVEYKETGTNKGSKRKIKIKQAKLEVSFFQKDTIKYIQVDVNSIDPHNQNMPIEDLDVLFYIKGMFSLLNFGEEATDANGKISIEFPIDMPGDTLGVLTIVAKIEEHKTYGTIESRGEINWGKPLPLTEAKHRGLGDTDAPLWMVYTLIILLSAVWFHYLYVIYLIIKIKLVSRAPEILT